MDWKDEVHRLRSEQKSLSEITRSIMPLFPRCTEHQVWEKVHSATRIRSVRSMDDKPVGVFSDPHIPFNHPNYLQFCIDTFKHYGVGHVMCLGDLVDHHAISRFQSEPCAKGAYDELDMSIVEVAKYVAAFPRVKMCRGNHDTVPIRQAATVGIGERFLKSYSELLEIPKTWEIDDEFIINNVLYKHGTGCTGKNGAINAALNERMSTVIGHSHSFGGCNYSANKRSLIFGLNSGCGIDVAAYAFAYGKNAPRRPTLGCGIVFSESSAIFVPMSSEYFRN